MTQERMSFNRNMGCIEMMQGIIPKDGLRQFNRNMGCIEIGILWVQGEAAARV